MQVLQLNQVDSALSLVINESGALHHAGGSDVSTDLAIRVLGGVHIDIRHVSRNVPEHTGGPSEHLRDPQ